MYWGFLGILFLISAVGCCCGFKNFVWFLSIGYGLSVALLGLVYFILGFVRDVPMGTFAFMQCLLFVVYGGRLPAFPRAQECQLQEGARPGVQGHRGR